MPNIPFPDVPEYPGVPPLQRAVNSAVASVPALAIGIGTLEGILGNALQQPITWGIFDQDGNQLGGPITTGNAILGALAAQLTGANASVLSTVAFDYTRETDIADMPLENGGFAAFNKVQKSAQPVVTLALQGSQDDRTKFLTAVEGACNSTDLYSIVTPEIQYVNYSLLRYTVSRKGDKGATYLVVEITLKEIRQVSATFTQGDSTAISNPQNAGATTPVNNGNIQAGPLESTLFKGARGIGLTF